MTVILSLINILHTFATAYIMKNIVYILLVCSCILYGEAIVSYMYSLQIEISLFDGNTSGESDTDVSEKTKDKTEIQEITLNEDILGNLKTICFRNYIDNVSIHYLEIPDPPPKPA